MDNRVMGFLLRLFFCFLAGCNLAEIRKQELGNIKNSMTKSEVLGTVGPPHWSDWKNGQDRWFYYMDPHDRRTERIIYFENNKVVDKGYRENTSSGEVEIPETDNPFHSPIISPIISEKELRKLIKEEIKKKTKSPSKPGTFESI